MEIKVTEFEANQRIDKLIRRVLKEAPISFIYKMFRQKDIKVNGKKVDISYITNLGDTIEIYLKDSLLEEFKTNTAIKPVKVNLDIIYEDENICVVNKPKGLLVHGNDDERRNTLQNIFINYMLAKKEYDPSKSVSFIPSPAHRLDRNTSGICILGKNLPTMQTLLEMFREKKSIKKTYLALLVGDDINKLGTIDKPLIKDSTTGKVRVGRIEKGAKTAITKYRCLKKYDGFAYVEAELVTGRTHQLRVHFQSIGHPIVGDAKYGDFFTNSQFEEMYGLKSQFLHASTFEFLEVNGYLSYLSGKKFTAKLPEKEEKILSDLRL